MVDPRQNFMKAHSVCFVLAAEKTKKSAMKLLRLFK